MFGFSWSRSLTSILILSGLYFLGLLLVRWHMIAKPSRAQLVAQIRSIRSWVEAEASLPQPPPPGRAERLNQIRQLLDFAAVPFNSRRIRVTVDDTTRLPLGTRIFNALFWTRGAELAGWSCAHEAEQQMVALLPEERVRASMATAEQELRQWKTDEGTDMANRLQAALQPGAAVTLDSLRALLIEALSLIYNNRDTQFDLLAGWHNKMIWLVACALLFIVAIGITFQNSVLLLVGAVGGLLSRLTQNLKAALVPNDYGASWGAVFLSPLTGALAAWSGILLMILGADLKVVGPALTFDWCNPYQPITLAVALLLGFTERLFDELVTKIEPKLLPGSSQPSQPSSPAKGPTISSIDPNEAKIGQKVDFTVHGANFQAGATANATGQDGKPVAATVQFKDSSTLVVTLTPAGTSAYDSTLTVANPDKQSATIKFKVSP